MAYNQKHNIKPSSLQKSKEVILESTKVADGETSAQKAERKEIKAEAPIASEFKNQKDLEKEIKRIRKLMEKAAKNLDFIEAAEFRDQMRELQKLEKQFK